MKLSLALIASVSWIALPAITKMSPASSSLTQSHLTLEARIHYQRAIEEVYWRHRIWPKENPRPKPSLDEVMPLPMIRAKVEGYLSKSRALEIYWQRPITGEQLQMEMERMARQTKQPEVLSELWAALGNDPFLIAECLARPALANRFARDGERLMVASAEWHKEQVDSWWRRAKEWAGDRLGEPRYEYRLVEIETNKGSCTDDTWTSTLAPMPSLRSGHTAVWTGTEMIVWGGSGDSTTGERYDPVTDRWTAMSTISAPNGRRNHTAVWTGTEMIIWGGGEYPYTNTGGRYDPAADRWTATSTINAPVGRTGHTVVWAGTEMIVWGGTSPDADLNPYLNTGGRYNPTMDSWTASSTINAPSAREWHTAVWTGSEMIIWGGYYAHYDPVSEEYQSVIFNDGRRYNPATNSWTATRTTDTPSARFGHTAVWTGTEMIIWGGSDNTGGRYDPATDTWTPTNTINAPSRRGFHTAVWTGGEMIVWGGNPYTNTGGRYDPATDSWTATSTITSPGARSGYSAVWTGTEMIIWGGSDNSGGRYNPDVDQWTSTSRNRVPYGLYGHSAIWTGTEMIIWGGLPGLDNGGERYDPATDLWTATSISEAPIGRWNHTAVWTGREMIVWGGTQGTRGGRYDPLTDTWAATSTINAPSERYWHTAVWTGTEMIVWGGTYTYLDPYRTYVFNTGGKYNPTTDRWIATNSADAPSARTTHTAVWTGSEMIVWGGNTTSSSLNTGGRYDPATDTWTATNTGPSARTTHTAVWTGREMIVWGGEYCDDRTCYLLNSGGRYDLATDSWNPTNLTNSPSSRANHTAVWTGSEMIVWGGGFNTGGRFNPATDTWAATSLVGAPSARARNTAVWTGSEMIVWGGEHGNILGGRYCARAAPHL